MVHRSILVTALAVLVALGLVGVVGYMAIADMEFMDALYMAVITLSTVGYLEVQPLTTAGRLFTILLILGGLGIVFYSVGVIARDIVEGEIQHTLEKRKVERQIEHLTGHYVVCGYGRMGRNVCRELADKPVPFIVVEREPAALKHLEEVGLLHLDGDATEDAVLLQAGIKRARGLVSALSSDSDNVYVVLTAHELNPEFVDCSPCRGRPQ